MEISRLAEETHAAAEGLLRHVRNGKQLQQQLQQQQLHFAAALGRVDSFAHSLQQLQQLARQEEHQLQQLQQQQKQRNWKLMDQWSSGEIEMQQQLLKTVLQIAAADAKHLDELRDAWIQVNAGTPSLPFLVLQSHTVMLLADVFRHLVSLMPSHTLVLFWLVLLLLLLQLTCLCALPRTLAEEAAEITQARFTEETEADSLVDTLSGDGSLAKRIGFTKEKAPSLLLLCLMLGGQRQQL